MISTDRLWAILAALLLITAAPSFAADGPASEAWREVAAGVLQTADWPFGYALVDGKAAMLIGAPAGADVAGLRKRGVEKVELVLLTHHHRDSCAGAAEFIAAGVPVRGPRRSGEWLLPESVQVFWKNAMPEETPGRFPSLFERFWGKWAYLVVPEGIAGLQLDLEDGRKITWRGWEVEAVATPGHSPDHFAYVAQRGGPPPGPVIAFCGDALCAAGKIWSPYTTDWHHVNDDGLRSGAASLKSLAERKPEIVCPEHGPVIQREAMAALHTTAAALKRVADLKSFERYTKEQFGKPPTYSFLAPEQVGTANAQGNPKPWTKLSPHLFLTGNTYALVSKDGPVLVVDPYAQNLVERVEDLRRDYKAGPVEVVTISHAHNDHYTGIFALPHRGRFQVWLLDRIADVLADPTRIRAPYTDARPVKADRRVKGGETVAWHEYRLKFHHLPGQTEFAMGLEVEVDGRKCLFTGDNFYHQDQYTGSGGWSGLNRGLPRGYASSARLVLSLKPDWILAEHGGAFAFDAEDFRRRQSWAEQAAIAADALSPTGNYADDWDPHRVRIEPIVNPAIPGRPLRVQVVAANPTAVKRTHRLTFLRPKVALGREVELTVPPHGEEKLWVELNIPVALGKGRHVVPCAVNTDGRQAGSDVFLVVDVR